MKMYATSSRSAVAAGILPAVEPGSLPGGLSVLKHLKLEKARGVSERLDALAGRQDAALHVRQDARRHAAFTMIEIAISLAIIGIALLGIIGVLPRGLHTQRDNREQTIINQDATVLLEAIRGGARGMDDLTNYVYAIVNTNAGSFSAGYFNPVVSVQMNFSESAFPTLAANQWFPSLTNGASIVGLLSTPEFMDNTGKIIPNIGSGVITNRMLALVRSLSGPAAEKPPQNNSIVMGDSFGYRVLCVNSPLAQDTNTVGSGYQLQLFSKLHELRLTFLWPQNPNGQLPANPTRQTFRATVAGQVVRDPNNPNFYFYQAQSFH